MPPKAVEVVVGIVRKSSFVCIRLKIILKKIKKYYILFQIIIYHSSSLYIIFFLLFINIFIIK